MIPKDTLCWAFLFSNSSHRITCSCSDRCDEHCLRKSKIFVVKNSLSRNAFLTRSLALFEASAMRLSPADSVSFFLLMCHYPAPQLFQARVNNTVSEIYSYEKVFCKVDCQNSFATSPRTKFVSVCWLFEIMLGGGTRRFSEFFESDPKGHPVFDFFKSKAVLGTSCIFLDRSNEHCLRKTKTIFFQNHQFPENPFFNQVPDTHEKPTSCGFYGPIRCSVFYSSATLQLRSSSNVEKSLFRTKNDQFFKGPIFS